MRSWLPLLALFAVACRPSANTSPPVAQTPPFAATPQVSVSPAPGGADPYEPIEDPRLFTLKDVFELEAATDPRISPNGREVVYTRVSMDIMADRRRQQLWLVRGDGTGHRPLTSPMEGDFSSPRFAPDGGRVAFVGRHDGRAQLYVHWMSIDRTAAITQLTEAPSDLEWSPDGKSIAFIMRVPEKPDKLVKLPKQPEGAKWSESPQMIDKVIYREDGSGYVDAGFDQLFVVPADGATPRQLTQGPFHHADPMWAPDGASIVVVANRKPDWEYDPAERDIYEIAVDTGALRRLTDRKGPDHHPTISPDGRWIAFLGFDDRGRSYHNTQLYVMARDGSQRRSLTEDLDRSVDQANWAADSRGIYVQYDEDGNTKIAFLPLQGRQRTVTNRVGGVSLGRPYSAGSFSVAGDETIAFTLTGADHPADIAVLRPREGKVRRLTRVNDDLFGPKRLGKVEELWVESSHDRRKIQAWVVKPPGFDSSDRYPLILEIHGGPFANYGERFSAEMQLYAAAGYVVLYVNPRGSTGYGDEFANLIHHAYPGHDYDDLMSAVDHVIAQGFVDSERLYVTGGSGGGVLTSWIVGKTDRFRAAVVAKPVINWTSFVLTADHASFYAKYWFQDMPWVDPKPYTDRSPLTLVGNVQTPTMLITGESDYRTPISESEQFYQALKLRRVETVLVRIPEASHSIARKPSQLVAKVAYVLAWFHRYGAKSTSPPAPAG